MFSMAENAFYAHPWRKMIFVSYAVCRIDAQTQMNSDKFIRNENDSSILINI